MGPNPVLPEPEKSLIPVVNIAPAKGWPAGEKPVAAPGTVVTRFAEGLDHPRWIYVLPNGDVLVAEANAPPRAEGGKGIKAFFMKMFKKKAGAGTPSANRITLLQDADGDGMAETRSVFLAELNSPFGMALVGDDFYVANTDAVMKFPYVVGQTRITAPGVKVMDLPAGPLNHHWTKNVIASNDGSRLYVNPRIAPQISQQTAYLVPFQKKWGCNFLRSLLLDVASSKQFWSTREQDYFTFRNFCNDRKSLGMGKSGCVVGQSVKLTSPT